MDESWIRQNGRTLEGKTVAVTGVTGGLGRPICEGLLTLGARLVLLSRDREKTGELLQALYGEFPQAHLFWVPLDLADMDSVRSAVRELAGLPVDVLIHNAGAYQLPAEPCDTGFQQVFQINFLSPYYMTRALLPCLEERRGKVIVVGSIAHKYRRSNPENPDFTGKRIPLIYGNSKRYLMFATEQLMQEHPQVRFAIAHPGLAFTAMSNHFSRFTYALLKYPMKLLYMKPEKAARSIVRAVFVKVPAGRWIGPRHFHIWGNPKVSKLQSCPEKEKKSMFRTSEKLIRRLEQK